MRTEQVNGSVYIIDAPFLGKAGVVGTYVVKGDASMVVDPGTSASMSYVIEGLGRLGLGQGSLKYIAPTHIHLDHAGGSWKLLERYPESRLLVHPRGSRHMIDPGRLEAAARGLFGDAVDGYGEIRGVPYERVYESSDGEEFDLGGVVVRVFWTPGHSTHHQSYFVPEDGVLIVGDAGGFYDPGTGVIMPTTPPPFNPPKAVESLEKLIALRPRHICYGHFGYANDAVEKLEAHRRQILLWWRIVEEGIEEGSNMTDIYERIREEDPMAMQAGGFLEEMRERSPSINLLGFVKYYEWMKEIGAKG